MTVITSRTISYRLRVKLYVASLTRNVYIPLIGEASITLIERMPTIQHYTAQQCISKYYEGQVAFVNAVMVLRKRLDGLGLEERCGRRKISI